MVIMMAVVAVVTVMMHMYPTMICDFNCRSSTVNWRMVISCTQNVRRDGSNFTWHQPCNNQAALSVQHFGGYYQNNNNNKTRYLRE